jgi:hypothetical protein
VRQLSPGNGLISRSACPATAQDGIPSDFRIAPGSPSGSRPSVLSCTKRSRGTPLELWPTGPLSSAPGHPRCRDLCPSLRWLLVMRALDRNSARLADLRTGLCPIPTGRAAHATPKVTGCAVGWQRGATSRPARFPCPPSGRPPCREPRLRSLRSLGSLGHQKTPQPAQPAPLVWKDGGNMRCGKNKWLGWSGLGLSVEPKWGWGECAPRVETMSERCQWSGIIPCDSELPPPC